MSTRARTQKRSKKKANWVLRCLLILVAAFLFLQFVQMHVQLKEKKLEWIELNNSINRQELINEDLEEQGANAEQIVEREANDSGLYMPGQQIYQGSAG